MRRPLIIGAHKLFMTLREAMAFAHQVPTLVQVQELAVEAVVSPSVLNLAHVADILADAGIGVAAQTFHQEHRGAHTGQVSLEELAQLGVGYVILGHKELVAHHLEQSPATLAPKLAACLRQGIAPIVFVPDLPEPTSGVRDLAAKHLEAFLRPAMREDLPLGDVVVAYEPPSLPAGGDVFASSAWRETTIRHLDALRVGRARLGEAAAGVRFVYGGGVNEPSVAPLLRELQVDGLLVGRASTDPASFVRILHAAHDGVASTVVAQRADSAVPAIRAGACHEPR